MKIMKVFDPGRLLDPLVYHQCSESYRGTEGTFKNLNTFFKNSQYNCRLDDCNHQFDVCAIVDWTLRSHRFDACTTIDSTLMQPSNRRDVYATIVYLTLLQLWIRSIYNLIKVCANLDSTLPQLCNCLHRIQMFHIAILDVQASFFR